MSASLKELTSFIGIALLILAIVFIQVSRNRLSGWLARSISLIAYLCLIFGALIVIYIVFSGPTQ